VASCLLFPKYIFEKYVLGYCENNVVNLRVILTRRGCDIYMCEPTDKTENDNNWFEANQKKTFLLVFVFVFIFIELILRIFTKNLYVINLKSKVLFQAIQRRISIYSFR